MNDSAVFRVDGGFFSLFLCFFEDGDQDGMYAHVYEQDPAVIVCELGLFCLILAIG
jgi:hypothetical protein